jgi:hypothetical protein
MLALRKDMLTLQALLSNLPVNTDAHGRPLPSVAPSRVRRLRLRYTSAGNVPAPTKFEVLPARPALQTP